MKTIHVILGMVQIAGLASAQSTPPARPEFEVAEIRMSPPGATETHARILPSGQVDVRNLPMMEILKFGFDLRDEDITGGPNWINDQRYDIVGKMPPQTLEPIARQMVQNLMIDRMKLKTHMEQKTMGIYALVIGKGGSKLQTAAGTGRSDCKSGPGVEGQQHLICTNVSMPELASHLPQMASRYIGDRRMVDMTGLKGTFDFKLDWAPRPLEPADLPSGPTIYEAVEKLGLKIEERKQPMPIVVIDSIERTPPEN
jgi:uncharacterized protein (TIGR03435 family)